MAFRSFLKHEVQILEVQKQLQDAVPTNQSLEKEIAKWKDLALRAFRRGKKRIAKQNVLLEQISCKSKNLEAQLQEATATNKLVLEHLTRVQKDQKYELTTSFSQVITYFEDCPNWTFKNLTAKERKSQGTIKVFQNSEPLAIEIAKLWRCHDEQCDLVTAKVVMTPGCVKAANNLYYEHGFIPSPFKGKVGCCWNSLHIGTCDSA